ncbi:DUF5979 domain-containing protein [Leucobacter sp. NPDC015123]|uniref:DUF5979 domain-containing protein n=1 Tax=Leucobacter sp. NPDC015123 TaxID=3364129 RepID=UPI0036F45973
MTSNHFILEQRTRSRTVLALILSALVVFGVVVAAPAPAHAASEVQIDNVAFETDTVADGSRQSLHVDWSIPAKATNPVTLSVDLPPGMTGSPDQFDMKGPGGVTAGTCVVTTTNITCTVDPDFIQANPYGVSGSFWFDVRIDVRNDTTTEHTFDFGGQSVPVTVEPNPAYCDEVCEFAGYRFKKSGSYNSLDDVITWTVRLPAPPSGIPAGSNVTITDQLDTDIFELVTDYEGETWPQLWEGRCLRPNSNNQEAPRWLERASGTWNADKTEVSFVSRAGTSTSSSCTNVPSGSFYQAIWKVKVKDLGKAGTYENSATYTIDGVTSDPTKGSATRRSGGGDVDGSNFGNFSVTKELQGDTVLNPTFTVNYDAYDDAVDPNTPYKSGSFEVKSGQTFTSEDFFDGTRVVLREVQPTDPANVTWEAPAFVGQDGQQLTEVRFSKANGNLDQTTAITLVNEATLRTGELTARKVVENPDGLMTGVDAFRIGYSREEAVDKGIQNLTGGQFMLPADGSEIKLDLLADVGYSFFEWFTPAPAGTSWADPVYTVNGVDYAENELVNLPLDGAIDLTVTNRITQNTGGFAVTKSVSGEGESLVPTGTEFTVNYSYTAVNGFEAGSGTVTVKADESSSEISGIPEGATVTLDEVRPVDPIGGTWGEPLFDIAQFTVVKDQVVQISLDNPIAWNDGDFSVMKQVDGDAAPLVGEDVAFNVNYSYVLPEALGITPGTGTGTLTVLNNGSAVTSTSLPYGTEVTLTEATPPAIAGGTWTDAAFDHTNFTIGDETTLAVKLTNTIERDLGSFSVTKTLTGSGKHLIADDVTFTVEYSYPAGPGFEAGSGTVEVTAGSDPVVVSGIPANAIVTLSEVAPDGVEGGTWRPASFTTGNVITVAKDDTVSVGVENTIDLNNGAFSVTKLIDGTGQDLVAGSTMFTVAYSYPAGEGFEAGSGSLTVKADGTAVTSKPIPYGATVGLTEAIPVEIPGGTWTGAKFSIETVTIGDGNVVGVSLTNSIAKDRPVDPEKPEDKGDGELAQTGMGPESLLLIPLAALLVLLGAGLLNARRRA